MSACRKMKIDLYLSHFNEIQLQMAKRPQHKVTYIEHDRKENRLELIGTGNNFLNRTDSTGTKIRNS